MSLKSSALTLAAIVGIGIGWGSGCNTVKYVMYYDRYDPHSRISEFDRVYMAEKDLRPVERLSEKSWGPVANFMLGNYGKKLAIEDFLADHKYF